MLMILPAGSFSNTVGLSYVHLPAGNDPSQININLIKFGLLAGYLCLPAGRLSLLL